MKSLAALPILLVLTIGCHRAAITPFERSMQRTELFFGLSIPGGGEVDQQQWQTFVDEVITPRFPDGFTVIDAAGQWRQASGTIAHEKSKILIVLHDADATSAQKLEEIRDAYRKRFRQEAVIREDEGVKVSF